MIGDICLLKVWHRHLVVNPASSDDWSPFWVVVFDPGEPRDQHVKRTNTADSRLCIPAVCLAAEPAPVGIGDCTPSRSAISLALLQFESPRVSLCLIGLDAGCSRSE